MRTNRHFGKLVIVAAIVAAVGGWLSFHRDRTRAIPAVTHENAGGTLPQPPTAGSPASVTPRTSGAQPRSAPPVLSPEILAGWLRDFTPPVQPVPPVPESSLIRLLATTIDTSTPSPPAGASGEKDSSSQRPTPRSTLPFLVQFDRPIGAAERAPLTRAGLIIRGYIPNNAFLVEGRVDQMAALRSQVPNGWTGEFPVEAKIDPFLRSIPDRVRRQYAGSFDSEIRMTVSVQSLAPEDASWVAERTVHEGGRVLAVTAGRRWGLVRAEVPWRALMPLAREGAVQWIEIYIAPRLVNDVAVHANMMNVANVWNTYGLTGSNQVIGHADTGLDVGDMETLHPDLRGRIKAALALGRPDDWSDPHGHGTHTAGSLVGGGQASGGLIRGVAWGAQLVHQSVMDAGGGLGGIPTDLNDLFLQAYDLGARIHSDSWGSSVYGGYTVSSRQCDEFVWDHPDMLLVFSAGNDSYDGNANGVVDPDSIGSPATAKNTLTVGASESDRPPGSGGYSSFSWGNLWPYDYPANPISSDYPSQPADGVHQGMAAFSSRGPTDDGRVKPDVVAPGVNIVSCRSLLPGSGTGWDIYDANYIFNGGTSMSTPLAAGAAAVVREFYTTHRGQAQPSAALVKARLLIGARSLAPGQYGEGAAREIPDAWPNPVEGWGQIDLERTLFPSVDESVADSENGTPAETGTTNRFSILVSATNRTLRLVLVWSDYPAAAGAAHTLVNDLDIALRAPDGQVFRATPDGGDHTNNVESLTMRPTTTGVYVIDVVGVNVPMGPQPYAWAMQGNLRAVPTIEHTPLPNTWVTNLPYEVVARVTSSTAFDTNSVAVHWNTTGSTSVFQTVALTQREDGAFTASLPPQSRDTVVRYYLSAGEPAVESRHPVSAPAVLHSFAVTEPRTLSVAGWPANLLRVEPDYGVHTLGSGVVVVASASAVSNLTADTRMACAGWFGSGSVPVTGTNRELSFVLDQNSTLTWNWAQQFALSQTGSVSGILATQTWWNALSTAQTVPAPAAAWPGGAEHRFAGWTVDGLRQPDATSMAVNPVTNLSMWLPHGATASYVPASLDLDADGMPDWWEMYYFGSVSAVYNLDSDDDGFTNLKEYQDGTNPRDAADSPQPPQIAFQPLTDPYPEPAPWPVRATVADNHQVDSVSVWWNRNGSGWQQTAMAYDSDSDDYQGAIPEPGTNGDSVAYRIEAMDHAGLKAVSGPYGFRARYPEARVASFSPGPHRLPAGTTSNLWLVVSNVGLARLEWRAEEYFLYDDVEGGENGWVHSGTQDIWHIQSNRIASASAAWHFGNGPSGNYPNRAHASLIAPSFYLSEPADLRFHHWASMEYDTEQMDDHYWDGGVVELSTNGGSDFFSIIPVGGYPHRITDNPASPFPPETPCYGSTSGQWTEAVFDLSSWTGREVTVRFRFGSDGYVTEEGWYIDDVRVTPAGGDIAWLDEPAQGTVEAGASANVAVTLSTEGTRPADTRSGVLRLVLNTPVDPSWTLHAVILHNNSREIVVRHSSGGSVTPDDYVLVTAGESPEFVMTADAYSCVDSILTNGVPVESWSRPSVAHWTWPNVIANSTLQVNFAWILARWDTPLWWLTSHGLTNAAPDEEAVGDPDGDGMLTWQEYRAGTAPTNAASVALFISQLTPFATGPLPGDTGMQLEWLSFTNTGYRYEVWASTNLVAGFTPAATNQPATPPINVWSNGDLPSEGRQFYQIRLRR